MCVAMCAMLCRAVGQMDMEYLKNLIMQLYTTGEAEALLPVFTRLLSLGPEDIKRCRQVMRHPPLPCPALSCPAVPVEQPLRLLQSDRQPPRDGCVAVCVWRHNYTWKMTHVCVLVVSKQIVTCVAIGCLQGLEHLHSGSIPLPGAAAAVDTASSMFSGWGSWLGMAPVAGAAAGTPSAAASASADGGGGGSSPLARKGSSVSHTSSSKLGG